MSTLLQDIEEVKRLPWTEECHKMFEDLKADLGTPPLLSKLEMGEELYLYLVVSSLAIGFLVRVEN